MTLSMQLYSGRNFPPLAEQLRLLKAIGYDDVEPFRGLYDDVDGLKSAMEEAGLTARSAHYSVELLERDFDKAAAIARRLGNEIMVLPYLLPDERPSDAAGWEAFAARLAPIVTKVKEAGYRIAWHNHDFEIREVEGGERPLQYILDANPDLEWEADLAWIVRGGEDPATWLKRYAGRISALHVKDIAAPGENRDEDGWADVGKGTLDWAKLWTAGREAGATLMIAEHDNPSDFERFARNSAEAMTAYDKGN